MCSWEFYQNRKYFCIVAMYGETTAVTVAAAGVLLISQCTLYDLFAIIRDVPSHDTNTATRTNLTFKFK